ncbi:MAG: hypothetical protein IKG85_09635 [Clostridia bacterium]|nr:hypothetical protein [Clostridia bacterium]
MRSDVIRVTNDGLGFEKALEQAERVARYKDLSEKDALHLRLLTEEMLGMMRALTGEKSADFRIDDEDGVFALHLTARTEMDTDKRRKLLAVSTSGRNSAARGVTGKLRDLFERLLTPDDITLGDGMAAGFALGGFDPEYGGVYFGADNYWSLKKYSDEINRGGEPDENWDELEKSVVARLADDVRIGIIGRDVEMTITKKF